MSETTQLAELTIGCRVSRNRSSRIIADGNRVNEEPGLTIPELLASHGDRVQRFCGRLTGWHCDSTDLAQDVFVIAIEQQSKFRGESSVETWLLGISLRVCRRWIRRQSLRRKFLGWLSETQPLTIADSVGSIELADQIQTGLRKLKPKHREILILRYLEELEIPEIASLLQLSRSAIDQRLTRARNELGDWLEQ